MDRTTRLFGWQSGLTARLSLANPGTYTLAAQAGLAGTLRTLPYLIFSLPAGALIDRWDRKRVMILSDIVRGLALGSIPLAFAFGHLTIIQLYWEASSFD